PELRSATATDVDQLAAQDHAGGPVALRTVAAPRQLVDRELLPRQQQGVIDGVREQLDVHHAVLARGVVGRERADQVRRLQLLGLLGGEVRLDRRQGERRARAAFAEQLLELLREQL